MAGEPVDGALGFQPAATRIAERVHEFHVVLLWIITAITLLVLALLLYVMVRYKKSSNPESRKFSHNTTVEVVWTVVPALILVGIAGLSFPLLYYKDVPPNLTQIVATSERLLAEGRSAQHQSFTRNHFPDAAAEGFITVKVQGNQWNWTYTYSDLIDESGFPVEFVSNPLHRGRASDPAEGVRLLSTDYPMVIPVNRYIRYQTAAADVIHSWTVPAFGIKTDAIPGRLNEGWFLVNQTGVYFGQCSELCGIDHAYMPIEVRVVPQAQYDRWAELMLAGDFDAAAASVRQIADAGTAQYASN
ncbi:cytochrome c oxidase subunit II [Hyphomonas sp.]|uniref:cytochrome c oxidase subunit II n=1 Tax=Hyphomonas sp. TaxID=87 RepID=UPI00391B24EB